MQSIFTEGLGFDGSSLRAWKTIDESDMLVVPDSATAVMDPFYREPTMVLVGSVLDPITKEEYTRDPRNVARRAEQYVRSTGIADTVYFGPEAEFFLFDSVQFSNNPWSTYYQIESEEGSWTSGEEGPNTGHRPRVKGGYFPVPPIDRLQDLRSEMMMVMEDVGIEMECQHHEVATAGQAEIDMRFDTLVTMADKLQWFKIHREERGRGGPARPPRSCPSRSTTTTAAACTSTRRSGRTGPTCSPVTAMRASRTWVATPSAGSCATPTR